MAELIHIRNLEKFHPGYKDRGLIWAKVYFSMVQGDPEMEMIKNEIDKWRFVAMIILELQSKKPLPNTDNYWGLKFDIKKRPMSKTLDMLHGFIERVTGSEESPLPREEKSREENIQKRREEKMEFIPPVVQEVIDFFEEHGFPAPLATKAFEYYDQADWHDSRGKKVKNWKQKMISVWLKEENRNGTTQRSNGQAGYRKSGAGGETTEADLRSSYKIGLAKLDEERARGGKTG